MFAQPFLTRVPDNLFLLNPKHRGFLNGEDRKFYDFTCGAVGAVLLVVLMFGGLGGGMLYSGGNELLVRDRLARNGVDLRATITDHDYTSSTNKGRTTYSYYITYKYSIPVPNATIASRFSNRQQVSYDNYNDLSDGEAITIRYLPNDPSVSRLLTDNQDDGTPLAVIGGAMLCFGLVMLYFFLRQRSRNNRLQQDGQLVVGKITDTKSARVKSGNQVTITYTFMSPEGGELGRKETLVRNDLPKEMLPPIGTPVAIVYVSDKLYRML